MKNYLSMAVLAVVVSLVYTGIAQLLPQVENHPPAVVEMGPDSTIGPEDLAEAGQSVFEAACVQCHKLGESARCPDLASIGRLAEARAQQRASATGNDYTAVDYLVESLCQPEAYLAEGFGNIMPPQGRTLSGGQVLAVVAYLQEQGGTATVQGSTVEPVERFGCVSGGGASTAKGQPSAAPAEPVGPPEQVFRDFGCVGCHQIDSMQDGVGPALAQVGSRLSRGELYEAILTPDATMAEGFADAEGLMRGTLESNGFYQQMTASDYAALVEWLAEHE